MVKINQDVPNNFHDDMGDKHKTFLASESVQKKSSATIQW